MIPNTPTGFKRPNLFMIGAEKAGTTSLYELLSQHPDIYFSRWKEPNFFIRPPGRSHSLAQYESLFNSATEFSTVGEASTTYSKCQTHPGTAARISAYAPDARIIYIVRQPLLRVESQWIQRRSMSIATPGTFSVAVREDPVLLDASLYWQNLSVYRDQFDDSRILLLFLEDMKADPQKTLEICFRFLQLDPNITLKDLTRPRNTVETKREDGRFLGSVRSLPFFSDFRDKFVPEYVRRVFKPLLTRSIGQRPEWDEDTRAWFIDRIAKDNARLLEFAGKPADFWNLNLKNTAAKAA